MKSTITLFAALAAMAIAFAGCATSYKDAKTLQFAQIPYTSVKDQPWVEKTIVLPAINDRYELPEQNKIHFVELNPEGPKTLIFIHGLGSYLKFWRYQLDDFAQMGWRVIALDMVGYGKSDKPASFPYTMEAMADVVHELGLALEIDKPVLVGHSMGGQTALSYAIQFPEDLSGLVLTAPAGFETFTAKEKQWFTSVFGTPLVKRAPEYSVWGAIRYNNFAQWDDDYEWLIEERMRFIGNDDFDAYAYANVRSVQGLLNNEFVRKNLDRVTVPTVIIHGDWDRLIPNRFLHGGHTRDVMMVGKEGIKGSKLITLEGCGHTVQMDCSKEYNAAVVDFLKANQL